MNNKKMLSSLFLVCGISLTIGVSLAKQQASPQDLDLPKGAQTQEPVQVPAARYSPQDLALLREAREREKQSPEVEPQVQTSSSGSVTPEVKPQVQTSSSLSAALAKVTNDTCTQLVNAGEIPEEAFAECIEVVAEDMMNNL